uniref:Uncharacterized protein n=1 Tax=Anguilla anguilla TaxID=7936 RepID=A0A0E9VFN8_ANGAN
MTDRSAYLCLCRKNRRKKQNLSFFPWRVMFLNIMGGSRGDIYFVAEVLNLIPENSYIFSIFKIAHAFLNILTIY